MVKLVSILICILISMGWVGCGGSDTLCDKACEKVLGCDFETCSVTADCSSAEAKCQAQCIIDASCMEIYDTYFSGLAGEEEETSITICMQACAG